MIQNLKTKYLLEALAFAFVFLVLAVPVLASEISSQNIISLVNASRTKKGLSLLEENSALSKIAQAKLDDMIKNKYFAHTSPSGVTPWFWFSKVGYDYKFAGENLAINFSDAESEHEAWMESPTHKKNILNQNFQEIGVAVGTGEIDGKRSIIAVQEFGTKVGSAVLLSKTKNNVSSPAVLSKEVSSEDEGRVVSVSSRSFGFLEFFENLTAFFVMLSIVLVPMVFLSRVFEKFWIFWEQRERSVRVRYVN